MDRAGAFRRLHAPYAFELGFQEIAMRRPLLCLAATMLMVWIGFQLSADEPRTTQAIVQEASIAEPAMKPPVMSR